MSFNTGSTFQHRVRNLFLLPRRGGPIPPPGFVLIDFEGLQSFEEVSEYYNGGFGSLGSGPGPAYGISFGSTALTLLETEVGANFANEPSYQTIGFILDGGVPYDQLMPFTLNKPDGFVTGCSFYYCLFPGAGLIPPGSVSVYSEINGGGSVLATASLPVTPTVPLPPGKLYNNFDIVSLPFLGTAKSIVWSIYNNQTALDDIRFGV